MAQSPSSPASSPPAPASVPASAPEWASSEKPDLTLAPRPRPDADATSATRPRAAEAPDAIGPGGNDPAQQPGGRVDGGSSSAQPALDFDDDEIYSGRGNGAATGGTANAAGGDSGRLAPPSEQLSSSNLPREHKP